MERRPLIGISELVIVGLGAALYYALKKQQIVIKPTIDTGDLTGGVANTATSLVSAYQQLREGTTQQVAATSKKKSAKK